MRRLHRLDERNIPTRAGGGILSTGDNELITGIGTDMVTLGDAMTSSVREGPATKTDLRDWIDTLRKAVGALEDLNRRD